MKPVILTNKSNYEGCIFARMHTFSSGHTAPIYDIHSTGALNQIIGHVSPGITDTIQEMMRVYYKKYPEAKEFVEKFCE